MWGVDVVWFARTGERRRRKGCMVVVVVQTGARDYEMNRWETCSLPLFATPKAFWASTGELVSKLEKGA